MRNNYKLKITANLCQYRLFTIIFSTAFYSTTCVTVGSIMYLNEFESNCEYGRKIVNPQIILKRNQCLSADPFEVFFCNPNSWAAQVHFPRLPRKNISPMPQKVERKEWGHNKR